MALTKKKNLNTTYLLSHIWSHPLIRNVTQEKGVKSENYFAIFGIEFNWKRVSVERATMRT